MGEKKKFIRDSVYGDISLNKFEEQINWNNEPRIKTSNRIGTIE